jgi:ubiquinone/menaquinone biosynthesis C-methylase UbiE
MTITMKDSGRKKHWENIYQTKDLKDLSWFQPSPRTSLEFLSQLTIEKNAKIIDVGGGDSYLVDNLLDLGYTDITVLDISGLALEKAKSRLGKRAAMVKWIEADIALFRSSEKYDFWHDRATFHFLTAEEEIEAYINNAALSIKPSGALVIGTFSEKGPLKCSGIEIRQYSETAITERLKRYFEKIRCINTDHRTPFGTIQNFIFCSFRKLQFA